MAGTLPRQLKPSAGMQGTVAVKPGCVLILAGKKLALQRAPLAVVRAGEGRHVVRPQLEAVEPRGELGRLPRDERDGLDGRLHAQVDREEAVLAVEAARRRLAGEAEAVVADADGRVVVVLRVGVHAAVVREGARVDAAGLHGLHGAERVLRDERRGGGAEDLELAMFRQSTLAVVRWKVT